jgi:hypothetical protein
VRLDSRAILHPEKQTLEPSDLVASGGREILVTGIKTASSAGLNFGSKAPITVRLYCRQQGSGGGHEDEESEWELIGEDTGIQLPVVSWVDPFAGYGILPQSVSFPLPHSPPFILLSAHVKVIFGPAMVSRTDSDGFTLDCLTALSEADPHRSWTDCWGASAHQSRRRPGNLNAAWKGGRLRHDGRGFWREGPG